MNEKKKTKLERLLEGAEMGLHALGDDQVLISLSKKDNRADSASRNYPIPLYSFHGSCVTSLSGLIQKLQKIRKMEEENV